MRTHEVTRNYLQCAPDEDIDEWPDERIWEELQARMATADGGFALEEGEIFEKGVTPMRSFVVEPMRFGQPVPGRRRGAHRAADGRQGDEPRDRRRARARARRCARFFADGDDERARRVHGALPAPRVARAALLLVDDLDAAPLGRGATRSRRSCSAPSSTTSIRSEAMARTLAENYVGLELEDV